MIIPRFTPPVKREIHFFSQFLRAFAWKRIRADTIRGNRRMEVQKADENGKAQLVVTADGLNVVGVEVAYPTDIQGEQNKYFSSLSYTLYPED